MIRTKHALGAAALLLAAGCASRARLPEGAEYLPSDSALVIAVDLPALASTDLYKELKERGGAVAANRLNVLKFAEATGLNPAKDVRWVTFVGRGHGAERPPIDELSAIVTGTFDGSKMHKILKDSGMPFDESNGVEIFQMVIVEGRCRFCIAVLDDTTAAFGDGDTLKAITQARASSEQSLAGSPEARRLLNRVDGRSAMWGLARGKELAGPIADLFGRLQGGGGSAAAFSSVTDVSFFVTAGESISAALDAMTASNEDALLVADVIQGAGSMGKLALKQAKPDVVDLLSNFKVQVDGKMVRASASVPQQRLVSLFREAADRFVGPLGALALTTSGSGTASEPGSAGPSGPAAQPPAK